MRLVTWDMVLLTTSLFSFRRLELVSLNFFMKKILIKLLRKKLHLVVLQFGVFANRHHVNNGLKQDADKAQSEYLELFGSF